MSIDIAVAVKNPWSMPSSAAPIDFGEVIRVVPGERDFETLIVCEHASNWIPPALQGLGLSDEARQSHIAWDPGALGVAECMAVRMKAPLVCGAVSRLVYDCNRPPDSPSAMAARSERYDIPGNRNLTERVRRERIEGVCRPFHDTLAKLVESGRRALRLLVTVHSFAPVFHNRRRDVEIGIVHGSDERFARAMIESIPAGFRFDTRLNEPYSAADGVAYTLDLHGAANGLPNVMVEIRNDLIRTGDRQSDMAGQLAAWLQRALAGLGKGSRA